MALQSLPKQNKSPFSPSYLSDLLKPYSYLIGVGLLIRLLISPWLGSSYLDNLFLPFLNYWAEGKGNPYSFFWQSGIKDAFPYPPVMLWVVGGPAKLLNLIFGVTPSGLSLEVQHFLYRVPLVICDLAVFLALSSWLKNRIKSLIWVYWFSPLVLYINYLHGQLDVVPIAFLMGSFYFLFKEKFVSAMVLAGLSLAAKSTAVIAIPYVVLFLLSRSQSRISTLSWLGITLTGALLPSLIYSEAEGIWPMVYNNAQQAKLFNAAISFNNGVSFYLIPAVWLILFARAATFRLFNKELFLLFTGFSFGVIMLFIPPMPGWYFWLIPFGAYFVVRYPQYSTGVMGTLTFAWFIYFASGTSSDWVYWKVISTESYSPHFEAIAFTLLQSLLLLSCYLVYVQGVGYNLKLKLWYRPFLMGVGGDSGAGKSTFGKWMDALLGPRSVSTIRGDDMHKWERGNLNWQNFTHLNPDANNLHTDASHARDLSEGKQIWRRAYDHNTGRFLAPAPIKPKRLVVFEGLHPFYLERIRNLYDLKVFLAPNENLRREWKINRDSKERGYQPDESIRQIIERQPDSDRFIKTQEAFADLIIRFSKDDTSGNLILRLDFRNRFQPDKLIGFMHSSGFTNLKHGYLKDDFRFLEITEPPQKEIIAQIAIYLLPDLEELTLGKTEWQEGFAGFVQLFIGWLIFETMNLESNAK